MESVGSCSVRSVLINMEYTRLVPTAEEDPRNTLRTTEVRVVQIIDKYL